MEVSIGKSVSGVSIQQAEARSRKRTQNWRQSWQYLEQKEGAEDPRQNSDVSTIRSSRGRRFNQIGKVNNSNEPGIKSQTSLTAPESGHVLRICQSQIPNEREQGIFVLNQVTPSADFVKRQKKGRTDF
jgi:hypothetical protein